ncbi:MAG: SPOR domain-containing protein, partial [Alphaproteobacteria bacterium]|nr:SPOR domain-containing protein [Alphaproteobacteria bacterium]
AMVGLLDSAFSLVARNPSLVARAQVPWHSTTLAMNSSPIEINASGAAPPPSVAQTGPVGAAPAQTGGALAMNTPPVMPGGSDDEDSAESKTSEGNLDLAQKTVIMPIVRAEQAPARIAAAVPPPAKQAEVPAPPPSPMKVAVSITPRLKPRGIGERAAEAPQTVVVALIPRFKPALNLALRSSEVGEGDISYEHAAAATAATGPAAATPRDWVIQIGAFPTQASAQSELASYAQKAGDVLGNTARIVAPFQSFDGHTVYRARFGPLPQRDARNLCTRLNQKGQTCFAQAAAR